MFFSWESEDGRVGESNSFEHEGRQEWRKEGGQVHVSLISS